MYKILPKDGNNHLINQFLRCYLSQRQMDKDKKRSFTGYNL